MMKRGLFGKILALCLTLALTMSMFTGCGSGKSSGTSNAGTALTIMCSNTEGDLDPCGVALGMFIQYSRLCLEPLVTYDENGEVVYAMAKSYEISDDQLTWTFHLRDDAKWSDGTPCTAKDFEATIKRALDGTTSRSIYADQLSPIVGAAEAYAGTGSVDDVGVKATDDYTLVFTLKEPCSYFLKLITLEPCYPSQASITNEDEGWYSDPAKNHSNGAFYLTEFVSGQYYKLKKNPYYYDADKVKIEDITVRVIDDATAAVSAYKTGEIQYATSLPAYVIDEYDGKDDLYMIEYITTRFMLFNEEVEALQDTNVRKAISMGINRAEICAMVGKDYEASTQFVAKAMMSNLGGTKFSEESGELVDENIEEAKKLLADAGYPNGEGFPTLTYNYPNNEQDKLIAQALQAQLKENLGIKIELNGMESQVCVSERKSGNFEITRHNWTADYDDPMNFLLMWVGSSGLNDAKIANEEYDNLLAMAGAAKTQEERNEKMHEAEKILVTDEAYVVPIATYKSVSLIDPKIKGVTFDSGKQVLFKFAYME